MILDPFKIVRNYVFKPVATLGLAAAEEYRARKEKSVTTTKNVFLKLLVVVLVGFSVVWASIFLYLYFYYSYMPSVLHVKDVHLNIRYVPPPGVTAECVQRTLHQSSVSVINSISSRFAANVKIMRTIANLIRRRTLR